MWRRSIARRRPFRLQDRYGLHRRLLYRWDRPDALFRANDWMAIAAINVARHEFGLAVGREISIIGFDDIPQTA